MGPESFRDFLESPSLVLCLFLGLIENRKGTRERTTRRTPTPLF